MRRLIPGALLAVTALVLAACPEVEEPVVDDETPDPVVEETPDPTPPDDEPEPTPDEVALEQSCVNDEVGYEVDYPEGWVVNEGNGLPACSAFDPEDASIPEVGEIPTDIAVVIFEEPVAFENVTDFEADFTVEVVSEEEQTVDGRTAVVAELEHTGEGLYPEGHVSYAWYVDLDSDTLIAITHDVEDAEPGFDEARNVLDAMMETLRFTDET